MKKEQLFFSAFVIVVVGGLSYYFYQKGKEQPTTRDLPFDIKDKDGLPIKSPSDNSSLQMLAQNINSDLSGFNFLGQHDETPYQIALSLSNTDFVQLYNIYNTYFQPDSKETLTKWIENDKSIFYSPFETIKQAILKRLYSLDLR